MLIGLSAPSTWKTTAMILGHSVCCDKSGLVWWLARWHRSRLVSEKSFMM